MFIKYKIDNGSNADAIADTFDNVMTIGFDFPIEDQYYANDTEAIVADGITRDPIGISDFCKIYLFYAIIG